MSLDFRYRKLGYVALDVTDVERTSAFATDVFGLDFVSEGPGGERMFRCGPDHHAVMIRKAEEPAFVRGCWQMESEEDVERAFARYHDLGLNPARIPDEERLWLGIGIGSAFRVREPTNGLCFEYFSHMVQLSHPRSNMLTQFEHIGHYGIGVPDTAKSTQFATEHMGFIPSDYVGASRIMVALMRAWPIPNHHSFAYLPTKNTPTISHFAFMVSSIDDIGRLFNRIEKFDVPRAWGMGRHPTSNSIHLYINDPDGIVWEYTLGMEQFPETGFRQPRVMSAAPEDGDLWGAVPKPSMMCDVKVILND